MQERNNKVENAHLGWLVPIFLMVLLIVYLINLYNKLDGETPAIEQSEIKRGRTD